VEVGHADGDAACDVPDEVHAVLEGTQRLSAEDVSGGVVDQIEPFAASPLPVVPVERVERQEMALVVGEAQVDREGGRGVPDAGDAGGAAGSSLLQVAGVGRGSGPCIVVIGAAETERGKGGEGGIIGAGVLADVVASGAVGSLPVTLGGGVGAHEAGAR